MKCNNCGAEINPSSDFCGNCGQKLVGSSSAATEQPINDVVNNQSQQPIVNEQVVSTTEQQNVPNATTQGFEPTLGVNSVPATNFNQAAVQENNGNLAIVGMVLGILGIIGSLVPLIGLIMGVLAIVFGSLKLKTNRRKFAIASLSLGVVVVLLSLVIWVVSANYLIKNPDKNPLNRITNKENSFQNKTNETYVPSGFKRVGDAEFGYLNVPQDFVNYQEKGSPVKHMGYSNTAGTAVVTVFNYDTSKSKSEYDRGIFNLLSSTGQEPIKTQTTINDQSVDHYSTQMQGKQLDVYFFKDGNVYKYISYEYVLGDDKNAGASTEIPLSYSLKK